MGGTEYSQNEQDEVQYGGHDLTVRPIGVLPGQERHTYVVWTFLNPIEIPEGEAFMMLAPDDFRAVERIPDWYWNVPERRVDVTYVGLVGEQILATYFTCRREEDGTLFHTVVARPETLAYSVLARSKTHQQALAAHAYWRTWLSADPRISGRDPAR